MSANHNYRALIASSILLSALLTPTGASARGFEQWLQKGGNIIRSAAQMRNQAVGNQGYSHQPASSPEAQPSAASTSAGSNYYNIDPSTMRVPGRHQQESPSEQPAYTPPPSSNNSYSPRSAYHTGSDQSDNAQTNRTSAYTSASKMRLHAHAIKRIDKPERASVIVVHKDSKPAVLEKPEVLKQSTTSDTTWIIQTVDRLENSLRKGKS
jgi:hypothetical protein